MRFKIWLEERESEKKVRHMLLRRMGFDRPAAKDSSVHTIKLGSFENKIIEAIKSLGLPEDETERLISYTKDHQESSLQDLINEIDPRDVSSEEMDDDFVASKAKLPKGEGKLKNKQPQKPERSQEDQMWMAQPPKQGDMQNLS